jgi:very-short-patch-repair endonuclease
LVERQHGVIARRQLLNLGVSPKTIERRLAKGRLHVLWRGVYAAGRPAVTAHGWWMAAVLACGEGALLSHESAATLWGILQTNSGGEARKGPPGLIHVSVPEDRVRRLRGIRTHRRSALEQTDRTRRAGIPVTSPARTLIDLATLHCLDRLETWVSQADKLGLIDPETLRMQLDQRRGMDGVPALRRLLDRRTFALTDSELERRFLRLVRRAGLPIPKTQARVNGFRVDFYWPELKLIVETDGLRYHRTPQQQSKDRIRDQTHVAAGLVVLRFTHGQVASEPERVVAMLSAVLKSISKD